MTTAFDPAILRPGDVLLYSGSGFFSWLIKIKTWSRYSHIEIYDGMEYRVSAMRSYPMAVASRDWIGVGRYPLRTDGLRLVLRPKCDLSIEAGRAWFKTVDGQCYDWIGLLCFTYAEWQGKDNGQQFCSEFAARYLWRCGCDPFNGYDADGIAPGEFAKNSAFVVAWYADGEPFAKAKAA